MSTFLFSIKNYKQDFKKNESTSNKNSNQAEILGNAYKKYFQR